MSHRTSIRSLWVCLLSVMLSGFVWTSAHNLVAQDSSAARSKPLTLRLDSAQPTARRDMQFQFGPASTAPQTLIFPSTDSGSATKGPSNTSPEAKLPNGKPTNAAHRAIPVKRPRVAGASRQPGILTSAPLPATTLPVVTPQSGQQPSLAELAIPGLVPSAPSAPSATVPGQTGSNTPGLTTGNVGNDFLPDSVNEAVRQRMQDAAASAIPSNTIPRGTTPAQRGVQAGTNSAEAVPAVEAPSNPSEAALDALPNDLLLGSPPAGTKQQGSSGASVPSSKKATTDPKDGAGKPKPLKAPKYSGLPEYITPEGHIPGPHTDVLAKQVTYDPHAFLPSPMAPCPVDPIQEANVYRGKFPVPVQRPLVELWRPLFGPGIYPPAKEWLGRYNPVMPHFMVYGDFRTGVGINQNAAGDFHSAAVRANLEMDLEITATERIHGFFQPLDRNGDYTRIDFTDSTEFVDRTDLRMDTLFFEGNAGSIWGGLSDQDGPFDLPFAFGLIPFFYQNGVWANDAAMGAAVALPSKHSPLLKWSNYDATFFWASDQVNSDAFPNDNNAAEFFGTAWFIEAYDGYFEVDYAFVHDDTGEHRSYHNFSVAFTKRYFHRISNSVRFITNFNQSLPRDQRTAEGHLLLIENSLITSKPNTLVPYFNVWYGQGRTQSLARAGVAGGILNNTGINFETDGLTGYPTLDATGVNTVGGALGVNILGSQFQHQLILELAGLAANGSSQFRNAPGDQYAVGMRYQKPLSNAWIFRTDHMYGFRRSATDLVGNRVELRFKF